MMRKIAVTIGSAASQRIWTWRLWLLIWTPVALMVFIPKNTWDTLVEQLEMFKVMFNETQPERFFR